MKTTASCLNSVVSLVEIVQRSISWKAEALKNLNTTFCHNKPHLYLLYKAESLCVLFWHSITARAIQTKPIWGPLTSPGTYPGPRNTGPSGYPPY